MNNANLDEPYPLAQFTTTTSVTEGGLAVFCSGVDPILSSNASDSNTISDSETVVLTVQGEGIHKYNAADQKCTRSWSTPPGLMFACSAKSKGNYIYAVIAGGSDISAKLEGKVVWRWDDKPQEEHEQGLSRKLAHTFDQKIFSLETSPLLPSHIVLVNTDGSVALVTDDLKKTAVLLKTQQSIETKSLWSTVFDSSSTWISHSLSSIAQTMLLTVSSTSYGHNLNVFTIRDDSPSVELFGQTEIRTNATPVAFSFEGSTGKFSCLSTDGSWTIFNLRLDGSKVALLEQLALPLEGFATAIEKPKTPKKGGNKDNSVNRFPIAVAGVQENYLAVVGSRMNSKSNKAEHVITLWDGKFGTLQNERVIDLSVGDAGVSESEIPKNAETSYQISSLGSSRLIVSMSLRLGKLAVKTIVYLCELYCPPISLMAAMNRMKESDKYLSPLENGGSTIIQTRNGIEGVGNVMGVLRSRSADQIQAWTDAFASAQQAERELLDKLNNPKMSAEEFTKVFMKHVEKEEKKRAAELKKHLTQEAKAREHPVSQVKKGEESSSEESESEEEEEQVEELPAESEEEKQDDDDDDDEDSSDDEAEADALNKDDSKSEGAKSESEKSEQSEAKTEEELKAKKLRQRVAWLANKIKRKSARKAAKLAARVEAESKLPEFSHNFILALCERFFGKLANGKADKRFFPTEVIEFLIRNELISSSCVEGGILSALVERKAWGLIELALTHLHDIPEDDSVALIKDQLQELLSSTEDEAEIPEIPRDSNAIRLLSLVISAPRNDIFMQNSLKKLTVQEVAAVMKVLSQWIEEWNQIGGCAAQHNKTSRFKRKELNLPLYDTIIDYASLLFDSHFTTLILSPSLHPFIEALTEHVANEIRIAEEMEEMRGLLYEFDKRYKELLMPFWEKQARNGGKTKKRRSKWEPDQVLPYGVEVVHL
ncbi:hypothetical protein K493DRAFT_314002 [Basidiobolus meristosporus CBS 931.73]|uniref:Uncharacterized protein n=1 Tax=Basidiobolus meristosporus CBS 931.73 TaxID=1314790 RepID=A0A1Y1YI63_9FUNG|nr:hypothetical protein K493DRAFT_314002 [Basidiobolus meristosporus CBS 931.73]|eukprot:ORX97665.1 hypothetical protein K493DRAFT_314002 [Basidiobolus meristosporus CBS 931.73]